MFEIQESTICTACNYVRLQFGHPSIRAFLTLNKDSSSKRHGRMNVAQSEKCHELTRGRRFGLSGIGIGEVSLDFTSTEEKTEDSSGKFLALMEDSVKQSRRRVAEDKQEEVRTINLVTVKISIVERNKLTTINVPEARKWHRSRSQR